MSHGRLAAILAGSIVLAVAAGNPALALNPQPEPPNKNIIKRVKPGDPAMTHRSKTRKAGVRPGVSRRP